MKLPNLCYTSNLIVYEMNLVGFSMPSDHLMRRYPYHSSVIYKQHQSEGFWTIRTLKKNPSCPLNCPISNGDVRPSLRASRPWQPKGLGQVSHIESQVRFDLAGGSILRLVSSDQKTGIRRASWSGVNTRLAIFAGEMVAYVFFYHLERIILVSTCPVKPPRQGKF